MTDFEREAHLAATYTSGNRFPGERQWSDDLPFATKEVDGVLFVTGPLPTILDNPLPDSTPSATAREDWRE